MAPFSWIQLVAVLICLALSSASAQQQPPPVIAPPDAFFERFRENDREPARAFYKKYIDVGGPCVAASGDVDDLALQRTYEIVTRMLAGRPDILQCMAERGTRLIIIGKDQVYTDMPEYRNHPNPTYQNERVRGTGGLDVTSFGEENLLNLLLDRYDDESIGVHEFCHTIDAALRRIDQTWTARKNETYRKAMDKGLWKYAYAASNPGEYWAEIAQSYFDCNRVNNWNHNHIGTREQLKEYDPDGYELVHTTFKLSPETDWRYKPLRKQPSVIAPPARFKVDPYYTKFTWAREFVVVGSSRVSDEALLKANDTIRKMFAYRHDILKVLINSDTKLVVLGKDEKLGDLPEFKGAGGDARSADYTNERKVIVVPEEKVLNPGGRSIVMEAFSRALYRATALRPVDPDFEKQRQKQQYELRVKRMDVQFDEKLTTLFESATSKGLFKDTPAGRDKVEYLTAGILAYFDAIGPGGPVTNRESLQTYDPDLFALVEETMAYKEHQDWRFTR
jgi:hypothetical protein